MLSGSLLGGAIGGALLPALGVPGFLGCHDKGPRQAGGPHEASSRRTRRTRASQETNVLVRRGGMWKIVHTHVSATH